MIPVTLRTERLVLNAVTADDTDAVFEFCNDEELQRFVPVPVPYTRETAAAYTTGFAAEATWLWAIREREDGPLLGVIELKPRELASAELGYWQGRPHRGQGIMTEAALAVVDFGFDPVGAALEHIDWCAVVGNWGSATVARKTGFHYEGLRRRGIVHRDERVDAWFASMLRTDSRGEASGWPTA